MIVYQVSLIKTNSIYIGKLKGDLSAARGVKAFELKELFPKEIQKKIEEHGPAKLLVQPIKSVENAKEANELISERKIKAEKVGRTVL